jgi:hypothetical protein
MWSFLSINCKDSSSPENIIKAFDKEKELIQFLNKLNIDTMQSDIIMLPATNCRACLLGDISFIDSMPNAIVLSLDNEDCPKNLTTQKCIQYSNELAADYGMIRFYLQYFKIEKGRIKTYRAINK